MMSDRGQPGLTILAGCGSLGGITPGAAETGIRTKSRPELGAGPSVRSGRVVFASHVPRDRYNGLLAAMPTFGTIGTAFSAVPST